MGSSYPEKPSKEVQNSALQFISSLALLYPCPYCAKDFRACIIKNPPRVESRDAFSIWLCEQHNEVNKKLGKPVFPCNVEALDRRWGASNPEDEETVDEDERTRSESIKK